VALRVDFRLNASVIVAPEIAVGTVRQARRWLVPAWGLVAAVHIILISLDRNAYHVYKASQREVWRHPTGVVVGTVVFTVLEAAIIQHQLGWHREHASRVQLAYVAIALLFWSYILSAGAMHAPGFYIAHLGWLWLLLAVLLVILVVWLAAAGVSRLLAMRREIR
jgi:hypothetical protein